MLLSDRRTALFLTLAAAGCGFTPVYGPDGQASELQGRFAFDPPRDGAGFALVRQLERRLGLSDAPDYRLSAEIFIGEEELGVTADQTITRFNVLGRANFIVRTLGSDLPVTSGTVESFTSYSTTGTPFATESARRDANDRLMVILADQIVSRLLVTAGEWQV